MHNFLFQVRIQSSTGKKANHCIQRTCKDLIEALYTYEVMNIYTEGPQSLHEMVTLNSSNYPALKYLSLTDMSRSSSSTTTVNDTTPPHSFYLFSNPVEYFMSIARYAVCCCNKAKADLQAVSKGINRSGESMGQLEQRLEEFSVVIEVSYSICAWLLDKHLYISLIPDILIIQCLDTMICDLNTTMKHDNNENEEELQGNPSNHEVGVCLSKCIVKRAL